MVSRKDLSHIYIHLNDSVFGIFIDSFYFGALIILEKRPIRNCLYVCMYVHISLSAMCNKLAAYMTLCLDYSSIP